ncbi:hypothetical protein BDC45DRAFT_484247 [Circinella umbellata]|nr:hypothetical protein BDC45DRAFT_484247 [Circinella umbellata]
MELTTIVNALKSGDDRIFLSTPIFLGIVTVTGMLQWKLLMMPCNKVSTRTKQIISLPLLFIQLLIPIILAGGHRALTIIAGLFLFNTVLRCSEALYITPWIKKGTEAYIDPDKIHQDLWSCLRRPSMSKKNTNEKLPQQRPWYHLIPYLLIGMLLTDFMASWYSTFSGQDAFDIQKDRPGLFFIFFVIAVVLLTTAINTIGYILQLIYTLTYGGGSYDPNEWRPLMNYPVMATSCNDVWNHRWHQLFRSIWVAVPFRPVLLLLGKMNDNNNDETTQEQKNEKTSPTRSSTTHIAMATLSVFFVSGLMHEYLVLCGAGIQVYWNTFIGQECLFFALHGCAVCLERLVQPYLKVKEGFVAEALKRIWVVWFSFRVFPLFLNGFAFWELWNANPFNAFTPYFLDNVWRKYPILREFCGSYL